MSERKEAIRKALRELPNPVFDLVLYSPPVIVMIVIGLFLDWITAVAMLIGTGLAIVFFEYVLRPMMDRDNQ